MSGGKGRSGKGGMSRNQGEAYRLQRGRAGRSMFAGVQFDPHGTPPIVPQRVMVGPIALSNVGSQSMGLGFNARASTQGGLNTRGPRLKGLNTRTPRQGTSQGGYLYSRALWTAMLPQLPLRPAKVASNTASLPKVHSRQSSHLPATANTRRSIIACLCRSLIGYSKPYKLLRRLECHMQLLEPIFQLFHWNIGLNRFHK